MRGVSAGEPVVGDRRVGDEVAKVSLIFQLTKDVVDKLRAISDPAQLNSRNNADLAGGLQRSIGALESGPEIQSFRYTPSASDLTQALTALVAVMGCQHSRGHVSPDEKMGAAISALDQASLAVKDLVLRSFECFQESVGQVIASQRFV